LVTGTTKRLGEIRNVLLEFNHNLGLIDGAYLPTNTSFDGVWVLPPAVPEDATTLKEFGIMQRDRIVSINGEHVRSYEQLRKDLRRATRALEDGWTGTIEILVERNSLQRIALRLTVQ